MLRAPRAEVGLAFRHLATGEAWTHNDRRFPAGDLVRLPLALATYKAAADGQIALSRRVALGEGGEVTLRDLIRRTLQGEDRLAPGLLLDHVSLDDLNRILTEWGMARTLLDGPPSDATLHVTTPHEIAGLLARLVHGDDLPPGARQEALSFMRLARVPAALRKLSAAAADPAHLRGVGEGFRHLVFVNQGPGGYLLAILTEGRIGEAALAKVVATVDSYYRAAHENLGRVQSVLEAERTRLAPDARTVAWDVKPVWRDGKLELVGRASVPEWPEVVTACRESSEAPVVDQVKRLGATPPRAIALAPVIHLRRGPGHAFEMMSQVVMGTLLDVLEAGEEWWQVRAPDGMIAWARSTNLQPATDRDAERWRTREQVLITSPLVTAPRLTHGSVTLSAGTRLAFVGRRRDDLLGRTPGREEVLLPAAACRHVPADDGSNPLRAGLSEPTPELLIRMAHSFLGVPYLWGGTSGWGLDCSGFTQLVFQMAGIQLPRDSDQQLALGQAHGPVTQVKDLAPGDLVFFKSHVGLFLGRGEFIHASAPAGCVTVNALIPGAQHYASALAKRFLGGGRVLGASRQASAAEALDFVPGSPG
ncbi:MAG: C40 family peptidase [Candidatus Sericytochromatia bacterium]|nr:C40 family peptidase [Candidatus Tanganyikabacteria bacterium]